MFKYIFLLIVFISQLFSCGGCVDSFQASAGAEVVKELYDQLDDQFADVVDDLKELTEKTKESEISNYNKMNNSLILQMHSASYLKNLSFIKNLRIGVEQ